MSRGPRETNVRFGSGAWQSGAARLLGLLPPPPDFTLLASPRASARRAILDERAAEIDAARERLASASAATDREQALKAAGALAASLLADHRRRVRDAAGAVRGLAARLAARGAVRLDDALPTDAEEWLDGEGVSEARRTGALRALDDLNRGFGSYHRFAAAVDPVLAPALARAAGDAPTVLDLASGHGGFALALAQRARSRGVALHVIASDLRDEYLAIGRRHAAARDITDVEFRRVDALRLREAAASLPPVDVVLCTQSAHHFAAPSLVRLLDGALGLARVGVVLIDLARAATHLALSLAVGAVTLDRTALHDGFLSFRKAFVPDELLLLCACVPGGERMEGSYLPPGFLVIRTRV